MRTKVIKKMGEVLRFPGSHDDDMDPDILLRSAIGDMDAVVIMGYDKDGKEVFASSTADASLVLWLTARMRHMLMLVADADVEE